MQRLKRSHIVALVGVLLLGGVVWLLRAVEAQRPHGSDEVQIRNLIALGARAAMKRDAETIRRLISDQYRDRLGLRAEQVRFQATRVLNENRQVTVYIPSERIEITVEPDHKHARARFDVQLQALGSQGASTSFAGPIELDLVKEPVRYFWVFPGAEWRVVSVQGELPDFGAF